MLIVTPNNGQTLGSSKPQVSGNFGTIDAAFSINHIGYNLSNQGKHFLIQFPVQSSVPAGIIASDISLYNMLPTNPTYPATGTNELFLVKADGTTTIPITASVQNTNGWTYLPSGILLKWGNASYASAPQTVTFPTGGNIPAFKNIFSVTLTPVQNVSSPFNNVITINTISTTNFVITNGGTFGPPSGVTVNYLAIGN